MVTLDQKGEAVVKIDTKEIENNPRNIVTIRTEYIGPSGNPVVAAKNALVYSGNYGLFLTGERKYSHRSGNELKLPILLKKFGTQDVGNIELSVDISRHKWEKGDDGRYKKIEEDLEDQKIKTNNQGEAQIKYTPEKKGTYKFKVTGTDDLNNKIEKEFSAWVYSDKPSYRGISNCYYYYCTDTRVGRDSLSIFTEKDNYSPGDKAEIKIITNTPERDVLLTFQGGYAHRYFTVYLDDNETTHEFELLPSDLPNIYVSAYGFSNSLADYTTHKINMNTDSKKLNVEITPNDYKYGPGESATVDIKTTDEEGKGISSEVSLWLVDKAIFELSSKNLGNIFKTYWDVRENNTIFGHSLEGIREYSPGGRGGCFTGDMKVLMSDGSEKPIKDIVVGEQVKTFISPNNENKTSATVKNVTKTKVNGYLLINGHLKVTPEHIMFVNDTWKEAGDIQIKDVLLNKNKEKVFVSSIEWNTAKVDVYNLEVEKYHTYIIGSYWVHNEKGGEPRDTFEDTAYWNPRIITNDEGEARVTFTLPDNLTTWVLSSVGATKDTRVGQNTNEIMVTNDIIVRPIVPNVIYDKDKIYLSALVQNFTEQPKELKTLLEYNGEEVPNRDNDVLQVKPTETQQVYWEFEPTDKDENALFKFYAYDTTNEEEGDVVELNVPVLPYGYKKQTSFSSIKPTTYNFSLAEMSDEDELVVELDISSTILGSLPSAMKYLVQYPYGCIEQTTSRFVPVVIARENPQIINPADISDDLDEMLEKGLKRLSQLQNDDGSWSWWNLGNSNIFITSYVLEYLQRTANLGIEVDEEMLSSAKNYIKKQNNQSQNNKETEIISMYALSILNEEIIYPEISGLENVNDDLLALAVLSNVRNGHLNKDTNGMALLESKAKITENQAHWNKGSNLRFGGNTTSTAYALKALVEGDGDEELISKTVEYLIRNKNKRYWRNSFSTAQVVDALSKYSIESNELSPNFSYNVKLNDETVSSGSFNEAFEKVSLDIKEKVLLSDQNTLEVEKNGEGNIFSTLSIKELVKDENVSEQDNGLIVKRYYKNKTERNKSFVPGDTVEVILHISGSDANQEYLVVEDKLPSGFIPINEKLDNVIKQKGRNRRYYRQSVEYSKNGAILFQSNYSGSTIFSYKARVVNEGTFLVSPAYSELMYNPQINGISNSELLTVSTNRTDRDEGTIPAEYDYRKRTVTKLPTKKGTSTEVIYADLAALGFILGSLLTLRNPENREKLVNRVYQLITKTKEFLNKKLKRDIKDSDNGDSDEDQ
jgi:uncharacterized protein YfaS (alpha-2-macroglobulin family)